MDLADTKETEMSTAIETMSAEELTAAARKYDRLQNEGGEGYNPYWTELRRRDHEEAAKAPRSRDDIERALRLADSSMARECGTFDQGKVDALRAELAAFEQAAADAFAAEWTPEVTQARRATWNQAISDAVAKGAKADGRLAYKLRGTFGWDHRDIDRAKKLHNIA